jgi:phosphoglycerate dehydrogenase-like enzyme
MSDAVHVLVTMPFSDAHLDRLRAVSPRVVVDRADAATADYARTTVLYAGAPPRELARAPALRWVQVHMAGAWYSPDTLTDLLGRADVVVNAAPLTRETERMIDAPLLNLVDRAKGY